MGAAIGIDPIELLAVVNGENTHSEGNPGWPGEEATSDVAYLTKLVGENTE
jgi:hypothetical protein